jgi:hypothetical protein
LVRLSVRSPCGLVDLSIRLIVVGSADCCFGFGLVVRPWPCFIFALFLVVKVVCWLVRLFWFGGTSIRLIVGSPDCCFGSAVLVWWYVDPVDCWFG